MLSREECIAFLKNAVLNPPANPPLKHWVMANLKSLQRVFNRRDYLAIKHRELIGARSVLERLGLIEQRGDHHQAPLDFNQTHCDTCGDALFWALPGKTTKGEIVEFAKLTGDAQLEADQWIHPGVYCPNKCTFQMFNFAKPDPDHGPPPWMQDG